MLYSNGCQPLVGVEQERENESQAETDKMREMPNSSNGLRSAVKRRLLVYCVRFVNWIDSLDVRVTGQKGALS